MPGPPLGWGVSQGLPQPQVLAESRGQPELMCKGKAATQETVREDPRVLPSRLHHGAGSAPGLLHSQACPGTSQLSLCTDACGEALPSPLHASGQTSHSLSHSFSLSSALSVKSGKKWAPTKQTGYCSYPGEEGAAGLLCTLPVKGATPVHRVPALRACAQAQ